MFCTEPWLYVSTALSLYSFAPREVGVERACAGMEDGNNFHPLCALWLRGAQGSGESTPVTPFPSAEVAVNVFNIRFCFAASHEKRPCIYCSQRFYCFFPTALLWKLFHSYSNIVGFKNRSPCLAFLWNMKEMPSAASLTLLSSA